MHAWVGERTKPPQSLRSAFAVWPAALIAGCQHACAASSGCCQQHVLAWALPSTPLSSLDSHWGVPLLCSALRAGTRAYLTAPLTASNGHRLGTICFTDMRPRK